MEFKKYYRDGWGLHIKTTEFMYNIIKDNEIKSILEFGSGGSTEFFIEARKILNKNYTIDSLDHSEQFCYKGPKYDYLNLILTNLITCDDTSYENIFSTKKFDSSKFSITNDIYNTGIKNATYDLNLNKLKDNYDLVLIDGPNGNGRNFSYFYLLNRIKKGTFIIIDDYFHYDFVQKCSDFFDFDIIDQERFIKDHPNKGHSILKIK
jgi:hypothetical protein